MSPTLPPGMKRLSMTVTRLPLNMLLKFVPLNLPTVIGAATLPFSMTLSPVPTSRFVPILGKFVRVVRTPRARATFTATSLPRSSQSF